MPNPPGRGRIGRDALHRQFVLWLTGCGALALGALVYLLDRPAPLASLASRLAIGASQPVLGGVGDWLPTLTHTLAFSLFSMAMLAPRARQTRCACLFWFALNAAFETGQHAQVRQPLADALRLVFGESRAGRALESYFLYGTFDRADLIAAAAGALAAAAIAHRLRPDAQGRDHGHTPAPV